MQPIQPGFLTHQPAAAVQSRGANHNTPPSEVVEQNKRSYSQLVEYLTTEEREHLENDMIGITGSAETAQQIYAAQWTDLFKSETFPMQALACSKAGLISGQSFSTSQLFFNVYTHPNNQGKVQIVSVFNNGKRSGRAKTMIDATMQLASSSYKVYLEQLRLFATDRETVVLMNRRLQLWQVLKQSNAKDWTDQEEATFYDLLRRLPPCEQCFLVVPDPLWDGKKFVEGTSVIQQINYRLGFNVFSRFRLDGKPVCMIPSRGMMECYLQATRGENAPTLTYRFSLSPWSKLLEGMRIGERDAFQRFQPVDDKTPTVVDTHPALKETADADVHDFYHGARYGDVPKREVKLFALCTDGLYSFAQGAFWCKTLSRQAAVETAKILFGREEICDAAAEGLAEALIDMEHVCYDRRLRLPAFEKLFNDGNIRSGFRPYENFWRSIGVAVYKLMLKAAVTEDEMEVLVKKFGTWLIKHENELEKEFGLTHQTLLDIPDKEFTGLVLTFGYVQRLKGFFQEYREQNLPTDLAPLLAMLKPSSGHGRMMRDAALARAEAWVTENFASAVTQLLTLKSPTLMDMCHRVLAKNFRSLADSGVLTAAIAEDPRAFVYLGSHLRGHELYDQVMNDLLKLKEMPMELFNWLYHPSLVNQVFASDRQTLLQRALRTEKVEVIWRLLDDGARSRRVAGSEGPTPYELAQLSGRPALIHLLICAEICGPGWIAREQLLVPRLQELLSRETYTQKDNDWLSVLTQLVPPLPTEHLLPDAKTEDTERAVKAFMEAIGSKGGGMAMDNETLTWFGAMLTWGHNGGPMPDLPVPAAVRAKMQ